MKTAAVGMVALLALAGGLSAQKASSFSVRNGESFSGEITDSFCAEDRHHIRVIKSERNCILACVNFDGAKFVLYNAESKRIYELDNQQKPEAFAGQEVTVTGTYDQDTKTIHLINIRPRVTNTGL